MYYQFMFVEAQDGRVSPHCRKAVFSHTGQTIARPAPCLSNLLLDIKLLVALKVRCRSTSCPYVKPQGRVNRGYTVNDPDLRSLARTSREFWGLCRPLLWETFMLPLRGWHGYRIIIVDILPSIGWAVKAVTLLVEWDRKREAEPDCRVCMSFAAKVIRLCPNLRACRLNVPAYSSTCVDAAIEDLADALGSLKQLSKIEMEPIFHARCRTRPPSIFSIIQKLHTIESISFRRINSHWHMPGGSKMLVRHLTTRLPHLKHLSLHNSPALLDTLATGCFQNSLQSIRIDDWHICARPLHRFVSSFASSIVHLDLDIDVAESLDAYHYHLPHLQILTLEPLFRPQLLAAFAPCVSLATIQMRIIAWDLTYSSINAWMVGPLPPSLRRVVFENGSSLPGKCRLKELEGRGIQVELDGANIWVEIE